MNLTVVPMPSYRSEPLWFFIHLPLLFFPPSSAIFSLLLLSLSRLLFRRLDRASPTNRPRTVRILKFTNRRVIKSVLSAVLEFKSFEKGNVHL